MSTTIPSRTRSFRKPSIPGTNTENVAPPRSSQSPSRLPVKPPTTTRNTRSTSTTTNPRRPPSATGSTISNGSMGPPPPRANVSKPTATGGLQRASSIKRPSVGSTSPTDTTEPVKKDRSRPPITTSRHMRNTSATTFSTSTQSATGGHTRTRSSSTLLTATALPPPVRKSVELTRPQPSQSQQQAENPHLRKPSFNTLQQHYSPAKSLAPKPHPAAFLAPPSPSKLPSNIAISTETARLQNELLQLHLLHKSAPLTTSQYHTSARQKLSLRFHSLVNRNSELVALETEQAGKLNALALKKWQDVGVPGWGLDEKIRVLDEVVNGVWNMGDSGGKYARLIRRFERWLSRSQDTILCRNYSTSSSSKSSANPTSTELIFLEPLDQTWKDECLVAGRKLELWRSQLLDLGDVPVPESSLAKVVSGYKVLVEGMLSELGVMTQIERDAMEREREWVRGMVDGNEEEGSENESEKKDTQIVTAGAIWRSR